MVRRGGTERGKKMECSLKTGSDSILSAPPHPLASDLQQVPEFQGRDMGV